MELQKIIEAGFSNDTLGIKDPIGTVTSKNAKKCESKWTRIEHESDAKMIVTHVPETDNCPQHYTCTIPWKHGQKPDLINNASNIKARQNRTTSKVYLDKKGTTMEEIKCYFDKLEKSGYIRKLSAEKQFETDSYYLLWFPVIDRTRDTTKMRIVFDASAKDKQGKSLNSEIENTPNRLNDLFSILQNFR